MGKKKKKDKKDKNKRDKKDKKKKDKKKALASAVKKKKPAKLKKSLLDRVEVSIKKTNGTRSEALRDPVPLSEERAQKSGWYFGGIPFG